MATLLVSGLANADSRPEFLNSGMVLPTNLPFPEVVIVGDMLFLSGQIGNIQGTLTLAEAGIEAETRQVMENIKTSLEANGYSLTKAP